MVKSKRKAKVSLHNFRKLGVFMITAVLFCSCQENTSGEISSDDIYFDDGYDSTVGKNLPSIEFDNQDFDFGIIIEGEVVEHTFKFTNTGKSDLILASVEPSCGCTTSKEFTKEPLAPGEKGEVKVEFDSSNRSGEVSKPITVITNSKPNKTILYMKGEIISTENIENLQTK